MQYAFQLGSQQTPPLFVFVSADLRRGIAVEDGKDVTWREPEAVEKAKKEALRRLH